MIGCFHPTPLSFVSSESVSFTLQSKRTEGQRPASIPAWGNAPGRVRKKERGLKARSIHGCVSDGTGFQPSVFSTSATQGVALGWYAAGPSALKLSASKYRRTCRACRRSLSSFRARCVAGSFDGCDQENINRNSLITLLPDLCDSPARGNGQKIGMRHGHLLTAGKHDVERDERRGMPKYLEFGCCHCGG